MQNRSDFLGLGSLAMLATVGAVASPGPSPSAEPIPPLRFDLAEFDALLKTDARHRHLFASTKIDGGEVLVAIRNTLNAYGDVGIAAHDVRPVAVLYHGVSVLLGFDDAMWNEYFLPLHGAAPKLGEFAKDFNTIYDAKKRGNPCFHKTGGRDDSSIESLVADAGARFFVCNNATRAFAQFVATRLKKKPPEVYAALAGHLVSNATLVPAGVWAVHAVQERNYTLLQATL
jgi:intracellular sulfur oxidation DsrE/DsrF family protein